MTNFLLVLSAPSGGGKTTLAKSLLAARPDTAYSVSATTRAPRQGEEHGKALAKSELADQFRQGGTLGERRFAVLEAFQDPRVSAGHS